MANKLMIPSRDTITLP